MTAQLSCTLEDFYKFIGPKIRNDVASITKSKKNELKLICQECNAKSSELDAAHKRGRSRKNIIKIVLDDCESEDNKYLIPNLQKLIERIRKAHLPIEDNFRFLCKSCHKKYDDTEVIETVNTGQRTQTNKSNSQNVIMEDYQNSFTELISKNKSLVDCLKELFLQYPHRDITTTKLRRIYETCYPNQNSQKIPDYMWNLANEGFLESTGRSLYKLANKSK